MREPNVSRRRFIGVGLGATTGLVGAGVLANAAGVQAQGTGTPTPVASPTPVPSTDMGNMPGMDATSLPGMGGMAGHSGMNAGSMLMGKVDPASNGFDPMQMLVDWDYGKVSKLPNGQTLREYDISAGEGEIQVAPGIFFPAWSYNGRVPGPSIRCTEGDRLRIKFANYGSHPHTMHFHGFHPAEMDGVPGVGRGLIMPGEDFTYEFDADPFGCHLYHCHASPLKRHIHKGMYGTFIVDPKEARPPAREFMMMMNGFDTNFDGANEVYAVNTVGHEFMHRPIPVKAGELIRIYLINILEFDLINSFHLHAHFFDYYDTGTTMQPTLRMVDTISQMQGQRGILEFRLRYPGMFMFHAHVTEFTELGWMGMFNAVAPDQFDAAMQEVGVNTEWDKKGMNGFSTPVEETPV